VYNLVLANSYTSKTKQSKKKKRENQRNQQGEMNKHTQTNKQETKPANKHTKKFQVQ
jgi:hypothetical protein